MYCALHPPFYAVNISVAIIPMAQDFGWSPTVAGQRGRMHMFLCTHACPAQAAAGPLGCCLMPIAGLVQSSIYSACDSHGCLPADLPPACPYAIIAQAWWSPPLTATLPM